MWMMAAEPPAPAYSACVACSIQLRHSGLVLSVSRWPTTTTARMARVRATLSRRRSDTKPSRSQLLARTGLMMMTSCDKTDASVAGSAARPPSAPFMCGPCRDGDALLAAHLFSPLESIHG